MPQVSLSAEAYAVACLPRGEGPEPFRAKRLRKKLMQKNLQSITWVTNFILYYLSKKNNKYLSIYSGSDTIKLHSQAT